MLFLFDTCLRARVCLLCAMVSSIKNIGEQMFIVPACFSGADGG